MRFSLIGTLFLLSACGGGNPDVCEPGKQSTCECAGQTEGFQICLPDGTGWGLCNCACVKDCVGLECGPDRACGESCGVCDSNQECNSGRCQCPNLTCSGECCAADEICYQGACCFASCTGRECGSDGCGGDCGQCDPGRLCNPDGRCVEPGCGNGVREASEQCDTRDFGGQTCLTAAGQSQGELKCTQGCFLDISGCHTCGNGTREGPEECEGGLLGGESCASQSGHQSGELGCTADCRFDTSQCHTCGNAIIEGREVCDGALLGGATCQTHSLHPGGQLACGPDCLSFDTSGCHTCGDNTLQGPEICDGSDLNNQTCASQTEYQDGSLACANDCLGFVFNNCHTCGNGTIEGPEQCEGQDLGQATCLSVAGVADGVLACAPDCRYDVSDCRDCGNGIAEGPEGCDGDDFNHQTCADWGFEVGELQCTASCALNLELCFDCGGCCGHGDCLYDQDASEPYCDCDPGYHEVEGLKCAKDTPTVWPPDIQDLWNSNTHMCQVPECDQCGNPEFASSGLWNARFVTTSTSCDELSSNFLDRRSENDWQQIREGLTIQPNGTCLEDRYGAQIGSFMEYSLATCEATTVGVGHLHLELQVASFSGDAGYGTGQVYMENPAETDGYCEFSMNVYYWR